MPERDDRLETYHWEAPEPPDLPRFSGASAGSAWPLKAVRYDSGTVKVHYGTAAGEDVSMGGSYLTPNLDDSPGMSVGSSGRLYLDVEFNSSDEVVSASIKWTSGSTPASTSTHAYRTLATVSVVSGTLTVAPALSGSQEVVKCGETYTWGTV
ncbi:hypothetical protein H5P28_11525 [Ruficoccus amylovorans]|uniref:Uncharacterized protein n=1 Tax=Ruficoccus amylovorans TaxID=1804625 RepID=A0A842HH68_9BACT|nr:hypothetical protein [Ruficoccus amylovorans]MBC2594887.1 hypothetical protein [Ruficoccus amylovorans]